MTAKSVKRILLGFLALGCALCVVLGCVLRGSARPSGNPVIPDPTPSKTNEDTARLALRQFHDNLEWAQFYLRNTNVYVRSKNWLMAIEHAEKARYYLGISENTCRGILKHSSKWDGDLKDEVEKVRHAAETSLPRLKEAIQQHARARTQRLGMLSARELAHAYTTSRGYTLPDPSVDVDVVAALELRLAAAKALLERIHNPSLDQTWEENHSQTAAQRIMGVQVSWCVAYEVVEAEAVWLANQAPQGQRAECSKLLERIRDGAPIARQCLQRVSSETVSKHSDDTFASRIEYARQQAADRLKFPPSTGPGVGK